MTSSAPATVSLPGPTRSLIPRLKAPLQPYLSPVLSQGPPPLFLLLLAVGDPVSLGRLQVFKPERFIEGHEESRGLHPYAYLPFGGRLGPDPTLLRSPAYTCNDVNTAVRC